MSPRADGGPSMLDPVVVVKSLEVVAFCCFLLENGSARSELTLRKLEYFKHRPGMDTRRTDWGRTNPGGFSRWHSHASRPSRGGWPSAGTPGSQVRAVPDSVSFRPARRVGWHCWVPG